MSSLAVPPMRLRVEIDREVERDVRDARFQRPGKLWVSIASGVARIGAIAASAFRGCA